MLALLLGFDAQAQNVRLGSNIVASFVSLDAATEILTNRDDFLVAQSPFDRAARLQTDRNVSEQEYRDFLGSNVTAWTTADTGRLAPMLDGIAKKLEPWHLPFPTNIPLIKTTGREEFGSFYTRGHAIVFPGNLVQTVKAETVIHELFHVLSRQNPALQAQLYAVLGFSGINDVLAPAEYENRKVTNPDGVRNGWRISVTNQDQNIAVVPTLYVIAGVPPSRLGNPLPYFRLMQVENDAGRWSPVLVDGRPRLLRVNEVTGYYEQVGRNTGYLIHPDEILADNFVLLINHATNVATPRIIDKMKRVFSSAGD